MTAIRWTPDLIRSRNWSFEALRRLARECRDPEEGQAIFDVFWRKVDADPCRHDREIFPMLEAAFNLLVVMREAEGERSACRAGS